MSDESAAFSRAFQFDAKDSKFADPFLLPSNYYIPNSLESALDLAFFLYHLNPQYRRASQRVVAHFVTDLEFDARDSKDGDKAGDTDERDDMDGLLRDELDVFGFLNEMGDEWSTYGNAFARVAFPFTRYLVDNRDKPRRYTLDAFASTEIKFLWKELMYEVPDPVARARGDGTKAPRIRLPFQDFKDDTLSRIKLRKIDPRRIRLQCSLISGETRYIYVFEDWFVQQIKDGKLWQVNETPQAMLKAIANDNDFLFDKGQVFHFKAPTISGVSNNGWGVPETLINYRNIRQLQIYRRIDEAVGLDYMLPMRVFSPNVGGDRVGDASLHTVMGVWQQRLKQMIDTRRKDMTAMFALPFPVNYEEYGASGKNLAPKDLIEYQTNDMLHAMGYPVELFQGSLQLQKVPIALRMFENTFHFMHRGFDQCLKWVVTRVCTYRKQDPLGVKLQPPSIADDLERRNVYLQLAAGGQISYARAFKVFGITDPVAEAIVRTEEDMEIATKREQLQKDFERKQQGSLVNGGDPATAPQAGGAPAVTPQDIVGQAQTKAQEWLAMDEGTRRQDMQQTEASNQQLYALAKDFMEKMRRQGESQGRQQVYQQAAQQPPPQ